MADTGKRLDVADGGQLGLRLRITPRGSRSWVLACRDREGRMRRFPLGAYPEMGISDARAKARALHAKVKNEGADPVADRRRELASGRDARAGVGTLDALLTLYGDKNGARLKSWPECHRRARSVFAPLLNRPPAFLTDRDFQLQADGWTAEQSASLAVRCVRPVLKWGVQRGYVVGLGSIVQPAPTKRRQRVLSREELIRVLPALTTAGVYGAAMRFALLTLARREEVGGARWADIDWQSALWTLPTTKNGLTHVVPLSRQASELLCGQQIPGHRRDDLIFKSKTGKRLQNWDRATKLVHAVSGTSRWHRHDLRRTGATWLGDLGETPDVIEACLNHVSIRSALAANYNRSRYRPQVAVALQRLADELDAIEEIGRLPSDSQPA